MAKAQLDHDLLARFVAIKAPEQQSKINFNADFTSEKTLPETQKENKAFILPNDSSIIERYMSDFVKLVHLCGGQAMRTYYPFDFEFCINKKRFFFECKQQNTLSPITNLEYVDTDERLANQISRLDMLCKMGADARIIIYSSRWQEIPRIDNPIHWVYGSEAYKIAFRTTNRFIQLPTARVLALYELLTRCPNTKKFFSRLAEAKRPYFSFSFPDINSYIHDEEYTLIREEKGRYTLYNEKGPYFSL